MASKDHKYYRCRGYNCKTQEELKLCEVLFKSPEIWLCKHWYYDKWYCVFRMQYMTLENPALQLVPMAETTFIKRKIQFGLE